MYKVMVVDFNGTLAESKYAVIQLMNGLADKYGYQKIRDEDVERMASMPIRERLKFMKCPMYKLPWLMRDVKQGYKEAAITLNLVPGTAQVLAAAKESGLTLGVLSSNSEENIRGFFDNHHIHEYFDFVYTAKSIFGKDKALKRLIRQHGYAAHEILYVGDELRDAVACQKAGVDCALVTWGYDTEELLRQGQPRYMVRTPQELQDLMLMKKTSSDA
ncbi:HAD-IA family hydrolase [Paenibacillus lemnae]|uniref:HAD-IA family hydrolase n=1 Tax=Paenibacillus lemnae TaxID=1330551 RepID=A0A848M7Y9_PAELE|nr:HAD-IA family hydrolase [Paenibacillus lemnae]NMO96321.1 HAD-IA family hydrolase [Paenibacillus lemnae]